MDVALLDFKHAHLLLLSWLIRLQDRTRLQNRDRGFGAHCGVMLCELLSQFLVVDRPSRRTHLELLGGVFLRLNGDSLCLFVLFLDCLTNALQSLGLLVIIVAIFIFELILIRITLLLVRLIFHNLNFPCLLRRRILSSLDNILLDCLLQEHWRNKVLLHLLERCS